MDFRIADTFTDSLARLTGDEQKAVKTTAFDLQIDASSPGLSFHKLDRAKDKRFWSVRVNSDVRLIVHRSDGSLLLCYVDHHDKAYAWAERRRLETHPKTGAAQLVEIRETIQEIVVPVYVAGAQVIPASKPLFAMVSEADLLGYGVPTEWLADVRDATEDSILALADRLPAEAAEALLELATGGRPRLVSDANLATTNPFDHPDAQRRFRVVKDVEELARALDYPWDKWAVFLHPTQRELVERTFSGPARVSGSAGTGKTIVALHRAAFLARRHHDARVLLTTFSDSLSAALATKLRRLIGSEPRVAERVEVAALDAVAERLHTRMIGGVKTASADVMGEIIRESAASVPGHSFRPRFVESEWTEVVDARQVRTWEAYRDVARLGRKTRLPEPHREALWRIFERVRAALASRGLSTAADVYGALTERIAATARPPYDFVIVDEAQDVSIPQLRFIGALTGSRQDGAFFAGDLGQRIFQLPYSWRSLGADIRGRSTTLRINYRTSHQIRAQADRLLGREVADVDGNAEDRSTTVSVFNGPAPVIESFESAQAESAGVGRWVAERLASGTAPNEVGVLVRSPRELTRALAAAAAAGVAATTLDEVTEVPAGSIGVATMHRAKGLEFRAVAVMACDDEVIPLQERIESVADAADLEDVYDTERHLLYVACTRARDALYVSGVRPVSEFLADLHAQSGRR